MPARQPPHRDSAARRGGTLAALGLTGALIAACSSLGPSTPRAPVAAMPAPHRPAELVAVDPLSADVAAYYRAIETRRLAGGLMRTDSGADEVALSPARLAQTYVDVALREEHPGGTGTPNVLRRWEAPVRYAVEFGATVPRAVRARDYAQIQQLAARLAAASGHPIDVAPLGATQGNFHVLVLSESERRGVGARLRALIPGIDEGAVRLITDMPPETFCMALAFSRDGSAVYSEAVAVIRAEHPDLTRLACYHEELTQGLGLASDSNRARPSIFNDDQEFALITDHDLLLLQIHYDPRLTPGMTESRARPVIFSIATALLAGAS